MSLPTSEQLPPLLQHLMSNPGSTLAEIERQQRGEMPRDQMPQPAGAEAPAATSQNINSKLFHTITTASAGINGQSTDTPDSPNTALKRSLNILPPVVSVRQREGLGTAMDSSSQSDRTMLALRGSGSRSDVCPGEVDPYSGSSSRPITGSTRPVPESLAQFGLPDLPPPTQAMPPVIAQATPGSGGPLLAHGPGAAPSGDPLITPQALLQTSAATLPSSQVRKTGFEKKL